MEENKGLVLYLSQSLRKSGQFLFAGTVAVAPMFTMGRNPFVNQVSFFSHRRAPTGQVFKSQSLRKSGQFLSHENLHRPQFHRRRNPFVNQVSFFFAPVRQCAGEEAGRNPFVNQVSFFVKPTWRNNLTGRERRNPFVNQVSFFLILKRLIEEELKLVAIPS